MSAKNSLYFFDFLRQNFEGLPEDSYEKVLVISYFGKSNYDVESIKATGFKPRRVNIHEQDISDIEPEVYGYYDANLNTVHIHVEGVLDVHYLVRTLNSLSTYLEDKGYLTTWANLRHTYAKVLLFLFSISHVMVMCHPVSTFDLSYIHLFKALDAIRLQTFSKLAEEIKNIDGLSREWYDNGRPCTPRMLFHFNSSPSGVKDVKKFEHNLEDQIYFLLKKFKVISSVCSNSLFAIPANQEFVFVESKSNRPGNRLNTMLNSLMSMCNNEPNKYLPRRIDVLTVEHSFSEEQPVRNFEKFLSAHVEVGFTKGFDDNVGRHLPPASFTLPTLSQFLQVSKLNYFHVVNQSSAVSDDSITTTDGFIEPLRDYLDVDLKFSEGRCSKVLPLALATYQENSPLHYTREYHERKLAQAMSVLGTHGRGAMVGKYAAELEKECTLYWRNGRQMCQVLSLTGHPCTNAIHRGGGEGAGGGEVLSDDEMDRSSVEIQEHKNNVRYISTCNCGRRQAPRPDPYTLKSANYEFYVTMSEDCGCDECESISFPVFQPSTKDYKAAQLLGRKDSSQQRSDINISTPQDGSSLAYVFEQSEGGDSYNITDTRLSCNQQSITRTHGPELYLHVTDDNQDKNLVRQPSTTEYLPGMLHTESPPGFLPQFSSWSLLCLGPSSLYSHNLGLQEQPGLLPGSSYLLPWDVTVRLELQKKNQCWNTSEYRKQHSQHRLKKNKGDQSELIVKIFIGVEYECPRGHRFMAAGPDKVLKTSNCGQVKDTGRKVTSTDMPLYQACPCRTSKPLVAQLMRVHVVTPKAPVRVTLNPRVQPAPGAPTFIASNEQPLALSQSAYWILRLPYVYMNDRVPFLPPQEINSNNLGRFLAGCYGITEIPPERN